MGKFEELYANFLHLKKEKLLLSSAIELFLSFSSYNLLKIQ